MQWWDKPYDIELPTEIELSDDSFNAICDAQGWNKQLNPINPFGDESMDRDMEFSDTDALKDIFIRNRYCEYITPHASLGTLVYKQLYGDDSLIQYILGLMRREGKDYFVWRYFLALDKVYCRLISAKRNIWMESLIICGAGIVYGAIYVTTWNYSFPSEAEKWLWQACSFIIAFSVSNPSVSGVFRFYHGTNMQLDIPDCMPTIHRSINVELRESFANG